MEVLNANQEVEVGAIFKANLDERDENRKSTLIA